MDWKRRLILGWIAASLIWIAYAFRYFIEPELDYTAWTVLGVVEAAGLLLGLPLAAFGAGIAIRWLLEANENDPQS
jgi:hypothetical protein